MSIHKVNIINLLHHHKIYPHIYKDSLMSQKYDDLLNFRKLNSSNHLYKLSMNNGKVNNFNCLFLNHNILPYKDIMIQE